MAGSHVCHRYFCLKVCGYGFGVTRGDIIVIQILCLFVYKDSNNVGAMMVTTSEGE